MSGRTYWHRQTIEIAFKAMGEEARAHAIPAYVLNGLAVHPRVVDASRHDTSWVITQVRTGGRVSYTFPSKGKAQRAARRIAAAVPAMVDAESPEAFFRNSAEQRREWMLACYGICESFGGTYSPGAAHNGGEGWPVVSGSAR
jgi:hypothetical protein